MLTHNKHQKLELGLCWADKLELLGTACYAPTAGLLTCLDNICRPTKESLVAMGKLLKKEGEGTKISVRHVRKLMMDVLKSLSSEDERKRIEKQVITSIPMAPGRPYGCKVQGPKAWPPKAYGV